MEPEPGQPQQQDRHSAVRANKGRNASSSLGGAPAPSLTCRATVEAAERGGGC